MNTRHNINNIIQSTATGDLKDELDYLIEVSEDWEDDEHLDTLGALDMLCDRDEWTTQNGYKAPISKLFIAIGYYIPMTELEYKYAYVSGGKSKAFPKVNGIRYQPVNSFQLWMDSLD